MAVKKGPEMYSMVMETFGFTPDETWHVVAIMNGIAPEMNYFAGASALANEVYGSANDEMNVVFNGPRWKPAVARAAAAKIANLEDWKANAIWFYVSGFWAGTRVNER